MKPKLAIRKFLLGSALLSAAVTAVHAETKTWTGGTSADWNTADNWFASGVPLAADDVVFDGTGSNLNISLSAAGPLKSLTFTAGQAAAVNINTTAGTNNIAPSTSGGSLTVAAGSGNHKITGTGTASSGTSRDFSLISTLTSFTFDIGSGSSFEINGRVGGGTTNATYAKNGAGTLILSGLNGGGSGWQFSGASGMFNVNQGVVRFANSAAYGNSGNKYTVATGAAIELTGGFAQSNTLGTITLNGTGIGGAGVIRSIGGANSIASTGSIVLATDSSIGVDADSLSITNVISGSGISLTKVGAGTLTLSPASTNTYNGGTIVSAGTLSLGASNVLANSTAVSIGAATLSVGAGFTDTVGSLDVTGAATINLGSATSGLAFANSSAVDWTGGTLNITGTLGATSIRFGTSSSGLTPSQLALISVNGSGTGTYTLDSSGYLYLNVIKTWDGSDSADWGTGTNWSGDAIPGDNESASFSSTSPSGYDIYLGTANRTTKAIIFDSTTTSTPYTINLQESSIVATSRTLTLGNGGVTVNAGDHTIKGAKLGTGYVGPLLLTSATYNIASNSSLNFDVRLRQSATGQIYTKTGAGTLVLNADNGGGSGWIHSGFTVSQGVLRLAAVNATGNSANNYAVSSGAALELTGGVSQGVGTGNITLNGTGTGSAGALRSTSGNNTFSSTGTGGIVLNADSSIGVDADTFTINAVVSGAFNLTKVGAGTLALSGANTYGGATTVSAGTLQVNNPTGSGTGTGAVQVNGGTIGGTGIISGAVTLAAAGSMAPGSAANPAGTLSIGGALNVSAQAAGTGKLNFELDALANPSDKLAVTGTLTIGAGVLGFSDFIFSNLGGLQVTGGTPYKLITSGGINPGDSLDSANLSGSLPGGLTGTLQINGNDLELVVTSGGNTAPAISDITNPAPFPSGGNTGALAFTITDEDVNTVTPAGSSSNTTLVPNGNIVFGGSSASRTVTVTPVPGQSGSATITVTITDNGSLTAQDTFTVTVTDNYLSWAAANGVTGGPNGDSDNDGVKNLVEYALIDGGERGTLSGNTITFTKRGAPYGSDLTYDIESSTDLVGWSVLAKPPVVETSGSISHTFTPGSPVKNFARLKVTGP